MFSKKGYFLSFEWVNEISPLLPPLEKVLPTPGKSHNMLSENT